MRIYTVHSKESAAYSTPEGRTQVAKKASADTVGREWIKGLNTQPLKRIYVFYGEEKFRRDAAVDILKKRIVPEGLEEFNFIEFEGKNINIRDLEEACESLPFMSEKKLILVRNYDLFKNPSAELMDLIGSLPEEVCVVFLYDSEDFKPDKRTKMYQLINKIGTTANFAAATAAELRDWIRRRFADLRKNIDNGEIDHLIFLSGTDMHTLINEIAKVAAHAPYAQIRKEDIEAVASRCVASRVFELCDNVAAGKADKAMRALEDMITLRESAVMIAAMLGRQMRQLYITKCALQEGKGVGYVSELFGFGYAFQSEKLVDMAQSIPLATLRKCTILCCEADLSLKSSKQEDYAILKLLTLELINAVKQK